MVRVHDAIHVPLEDFDQVPGGDVKNAESFRTSNTAETSLFLWRLEIIVIHQKKKKNHKMKEDKRCAELLLKRGGAVGAVPLLSAGGHCAHFTGSALLQRGFCV